MGCLQKISIFNKNFQVLQYLNWERGSICWGVDSKFCGKLCSDDAESGSGNLKMTWTSWSTRWRDKANCFQKPSRRRSDLLSNQIFCIFFWSRFQIHCECFLPKTNKTLSRCLQSVQSLSAELPSLTKLETERPGEAHKWVVFDLQSRWRLVPSYIAPTCLLNFIRTWIENFSKWYRGW